MNPPGSTGTQNGSPRRAGVVVVVDPCPDRASKFSTMLEGVCASVVVEPNPIKAASVLRSAPIALALAAVDQKPAAGNSDLAALRGLAATSRPVITYGVGIDRWEICARCLPLVAGARCLLDFQRERFAEELLTIVRGELETAGCHADKERELLVAMHGLGITGTSRQMMEVFGTVVRFSQLSDLPVLISGETGTGKEQMARALHQLDPKRSRGPFVPVNCGALNVTLAESELFGHRRGAFTGADRDRPGLIRAARGGVLFLDEVGELPEAIQTKLLRVLQEGQVLTVGQEREERVDVRIVAATNRNLAQGIAQGTFRPDLWHRLNVLALHLPPLRERREDIRPLLEHFLEIHARALCRPRPELSGEVVEAFKQLELSGNVRELENMVRRALVNLRSPAALRLGDLPPEVWHELADSSGAKGHGGPKSGPGTAEDLALQVRPHFHRLIDLTDGRLNPSIRFCERVLISLALERADGNQSEAARLLHISPRSVYNKMRRLQIRPPPVRAARPPDAGFQSGK